MRFLPALLIFGASGAGYLYQQEQNGNSSPISAWLSTEEDSPTEPTGDPVELASLREDELMAVTGPESATFDDIFRFNITPSEILARWSRVSTGLGDLQLQGYRVPLVTGTAPTDLAGSLTYYFDTQQRLRRMTFIGTTGDPQRLVDFVTQQFGFHRLDSSNPRRVVYGNRFRRHGSLTLVASPVVDHNETANYQVDLTLE
jgi:hypothetical protein